MRRPLHRRLHALSRKQEEDLQEPLWAELFSPERLEQHARSLAAEHAIGDRGPRWRAFARRNADNARVLRASCEAIHEAVKAKRLITPAADWLVNNFHVVEDQLRDIRTLLPRRFFERLPGLDSGHLAGLPRVYAIAWAFVAHTDSRFDPELLLRFVNAYQEKRPLELAELWALPTVLRIVIVENARRLAARIVASMRGRDQADRYADALLGLATTQVVDDVSPVVAGTGTAWSRAFTVQLFQRLRHRDAVAAGALHELSQRLAAEGTSAEAVVQAEFARQAAADLSVRNLITSMRLVSAYEWSDFVEAASLVHRALCRNPAFPAMDFITRDRYRGAVEDLAWRSPHSEVDVARAAVAKAAAPHVGADTRPADLGYWLISEGRPLFERELGYRRSLAKRLLSRHTGDALPVYLGVVLVVTAGLLALLVGAAADAGARTWALWIYAVLALVPCSEIALVLGNRVVTDLVAPRHIPRFELPEGLDASMRTFVVVPTMLASEALIADHVRMLEAHYLSNGVGAGEIHFALLTDWLDAPAEHVDGDAQLLRSAADAIRALNVRHGGAAGGEHIFYLFHRRRLWNSAQDAWIGWERKRGKLHEFNRLLRGATDTSFMTDVPHYAPPPAGVRFVLTLDADTILPFGAAVDLAGTLLHPLNRPRIDVATGVVTDGYSILQPRVTPTLPPRGSSTWFQQWFSGHCGVDPYTFRVSDVYQDLFGRGTFTGKGMYEVDALESALRGRMPPDAILSHDLLEGSFARCAFVSDIELFEQYPPHTEAAAARNHRWARGDWQLLPWIFGRRGRDLSAVARWKMLDNLRRTLLAPSLFLLLAAGWIVEGAGSLRLALLATAVYLLPTLLALLDRLRPRPNTDRGTWLRMLVDDTLLGFGRTMFQLATLPRDTVLMADAIVRTLGRLAVRQRLLEWNAAAHVLASAQMSLASFVRKQYGALAITVAAFAALLYANPSALVVASPFLVLWLAAPLLAWRASQPLREEEVPPPTAQEAASMRVIARETWQFFATLTTAGDHFLPPDNLQDDPEPVVAHRTSPTNIGMYLVSIVAAHDFGWIGLREWCERAEGCLATLARLPRHRGHFLNWTETSTLRAMTPRYVSTVDSGNLAGCLIALSCAARGALAQPAAQMHLARGIGDDIALVQRAAGRADRKRPSTSVDPAHLHEALAALERLAAGHDRAGAFRWNEATRLASDLADMARVVADEGDHPTLTDLAVGAEALRAGIVRRHEEFAALTPWAIAAEPLDDAAGDEPRAPEDEAAAWLAHRVPLDLTLAELPACCESLRGDLREAAELPVALRAACDNVLRSSADEATSLAGRLARIARDAHALFMEMDFRFLYDPARKLFSIGYQVDSARLDPSYYDLLASEARLASFIAIAKHDVPPSHWFRLGRTLIAVSGRTVLLSWSGSMFEYLMPSLLMNTPYGSLLDHTCRTVVERQIAYARRRGVPWGISESAFHERDLHLTFQYSTFGVPELGLKRGLGEDLVVAPYATGLAAMYAPRAAAANFAALEALGARGRFGFYEALDFTRERVPETEPVALVRAYMAHHQGMLLVALANVLLDASMRRYFHHEPLIRAAEILLQETRHRDAAVAIPLADQKAALVEDGRFAFEQRVPSPHLPQPSTQLLSNGRYAAMLTAAGSGYSQWRDAGVTRWREDPTCDDRGSFIYLRDVRDGRVWSAGFQPTASEPARYDVAFNEDRVRIVRQDGAIEATLDVIVSAEDDAEIRRVTLRNLGSVACEIEVTSYSEITLTPQAADAAHPAFSNLFVRSEFVPQVAGLVFTRRPRASTDRALHAAHVVATEAAAGIEFETDRARFIGRGRTVRAPVAISEGRPLTNSAGAVLDPIASLRVRLRVPAGESVQVAFATMVAETREQVLDLADKYHDPAAFERASSLAWTHAQVQLHYLGIEHGEAHLYQQLANALLYHDAAMRPSQRTLQSNTLPISGLWRLGISGDRPIVLARIDDVDDRGLLRQLLTAHEYWNLKGLAVDLVLLNDQAVTYAPGVQEHLQTLVRDAQSRASHDRRVVRGEVFVVRGDGLAPDERVLLQAAARVIVASTQGSLVEQLMRVRPAAAPREPPQAPPRASGRKLDVPRLRFFNGLGGFTPDGREYVVVQNKGQHTPLPWIDVVANERFGFQATESGAGYTWSLNSREYQLTPWSNDPVCAQPCEAIYIRDAASGALWTPTALPIRVDDATYIARFGHGYVKFEQAAEGIRAGLTQFVLADAAAKISSLTLTNEGDTARELAVTAYVEWSLGALRPANAPFVVTFVDQASGAICARNPRNPEFGSRCAFLVSDAPADSLTCDRAEFLGRNGVLAAPAALAGKDALSGRSGAALDPCGALQRRVVLAPGASVAIRFALGDAASPAAAATLAARCRDVDVDAELARASAEWDAVLGTIAVETPDAATNFLLNRWLLYQTRACRLFARSGFYQAGGAYGFRDQLQDVMALTVAAPGEARAHIVRAAAHQFPEGDVQHWWHPPAGRGVRTHFSDDRIFLPFATAHYVAVTGDAGVLDDTAPFVEGPPVPPEREDLFFEPEASQERASVYEHCARALDASLDLGSHGLPLMRGGDWNDGMNRVGIGGRGESVWLAWFAYATLRDWVPIARTRGDSARAERWSRHVDALKHALDRHAWDGAWFRRAYFDDGSPLGSAYNSECRIDSIAQSWATLSGAADPARARQAMDAVGEYLVKRGDDLVLLFTPPFHSAVPDPGYVSSYLPGVRENGAQYTHAAAWCVIAWAMLGDGDRAYELFAMLNPINHAASRGGAYRYKVEPYVAAGDVYSEPPHVGRGGWSWYTGAAGWLYRAGIEYILGIRVRAESVRIEPCIPRDWAGYTVRCRRGAATYVIRVENPARISRGEVAITVDDEPVAGSAFRAIDDGREHRVVALLAEAGTARAAADAGHEARVAGARV